MVSEVILEAKTNVNARNTKSLSDQVNDLQEMVYKQQDHIKMLENNMAMLASDLANTKQMIGFLHGRGTGPSVKS